METSVSQCVKKIKLFFKLNVKYNVLLSTEYQ